MISKTKGEGEVSSFARGHALEVDGHGEGRHLVVRKDAMSIAFDECVDFPGAEFCAIAFFFYDPLGKHFETIRVYQPGWQYQKVVG